MGSEMCIRDRVRELAPIEKRGRCTRSTIVEAAIGLALRDVQARGRDSDVFKTLVTLPVVNEAQP